MPPDDVEVDDADDVEDAVEDADDVDADPDVLLCAELVAPFPLPPLPPLPPTSVPEHATR
jgi:hypothetical protein